MYFPAFLTSKDIQVTTFNQCDVSKKKSLSTCIHFLKCHNKPQTGRLTTLQIYFLTISRG